MSGTLAVVSSYHGHQNMAAGYNQAEAEEMAAAVAELPGLDGLPVIHDLLPGLEARFPVGTPVWLGAPVYWWRRGQHGVVAAGEPESYARWPEAGPSPWFLSCGGASVHVVLDDGWASWWPASWLEVR